mmetsp:Transcript_50524/g.99907  ORF Transcript_50524/g.99907 Transcript_50524/m.99907 type:complete len:173 (+) Transcript_50524:122-640(+)
MTTPKPPGKERTLIRNNEILSEFNDGDSPGLLALYYHYKDRDFDSFDASEYTKQMLAYYEAGYATTLVLPRKIGTNDYILVCLQNKLQPEKDSLCELAFQCMRQFVGTTMLVKKRCFVCHKPAAATCTACRVACFCSKECQKSGWAGHKKLCMLVKKSNVTVDKECLQLNAP